MNHFRRVPWSLDLYQKGTETKSHLEQTPGEGVPMSLPHFCILSSWEYRAEALTISAPATDFLLVSVFFQKAGLAVFLCCTDCSYSWRCALLVDEINRVQTRPKGTGKGPLIPECVHFQGCCKCPPSQMREVGQAERGPDSCAEVRCWTEPRWANDE
jgi:hypothetical protein